MAISKQTIKQNGLETNYHKINNIIFDFINNKTIIIIESYVSKEVREKGIRKEELLEDLRNLSSQIQNTKDSEIIKALEEKIYKLQEDNKNIINGQFIADQTQIVLDYIPENCTFENIYKELMNLEEYKDSDMI